MFVNLSQRCAQRELGKWLSPDRFEGGRGVVKRVQRLLLPGGPWARHRLALCGDYVSASASFRCIRAADGDELVKAPSERREPLLPSPMYGQRRTGATNGPYGCGAKDDDWDFACMYTLAKKDKRFVDVAAAVAGGGSSAARKRRRLSGGHGDGDGDDGDSEDEDSVVAVVNLSKNEYLCKSTWRAPLHLGLAALLMVGEQFSGEWAGDQLLAVKEESEVRELLGEAGRMGDVQELAHDICTMMDPAFEAKNWSRGDC